MPQGTKPGSVSKFPGRTSPAAEQGVPEGVKAELSNPGSPFCTVTLGRLLSLSGRPVSSLFNEDAMQRIKWKNTHSWLDECQLL